MKQRLNKISIHQGDIRDSLKLSENNYYDLIYTSNIFDNKKYCQDPRSYLKVIKEKLNKNGLLLVVIQNGCRKIIKLMKGEGFYVYNKEVHNFNIFSELLGHYSFSFLLFKKGDGLG